MKYLLAYQDPKDYVYGITDIAVWSEVECCIGIVAGSLAPMRPLVRYLRCLGLARTSRKAESGMAQRVQPPRRPRRSSPSVLATSYRVMIEGNGRRARGDDDIESDSGSQNYILPTPRLEIVKDTGYKVVTETVDPEKDRGY